MSTKIQINSLAALERLIGGEAETEIEIRNSVVQEFAKKHLRAIADQKLPTYIGALMQEVTKEAHAALGLPVGGMNGLINSEMRQKIRDTVRHELNVYLATVADETIQEYAKTIAESMKEAMNEKAFEYAVNTRVRSLLAQLAKQ
jgi:hypothetical protein